MKLPDSVVALLRCPRCKGPLAAPRVDRVDCADAACGGSFPIVSERPVLIDEERSVFSHADYRPLAAPAAPGALDRVRDWIRHVPSPSVNLSAVRCFEKMKTTLLARGSAPLVVVVGGGIMGKGMHALTGVPAIRLINVDPSPGSAALVFCDGHDLPFADGCIDGVVVQAVLEHVADPVRCVDEIHRVLGPGGVVYSEIPFMQQVHEGAHDFTRYSLTGHRRLFRDFAELGSGAVAGPGMALGWSVRAFWLAVVGSRPVARAAVNLGVTLSLWWLKELDGLLLRDPAGLDGASGTWFMGRLAAAPLADREILAAHRGANTGFRLDRT
jgi:SAM-dependent methyltransferase/uncharacterized protein YbaR (Trm112 family)